MEVLGRRSALLLLVVGIGALTMFCYVYTYNPKRSNQRPTPHLITGATKNHSTRVNQSKTADPTVTTENTNRPLAIHMVMIPYFVSPSANVFENDILKRHEEYRTVLQRNLNHEFVSHVHVLATSARDITEHFKDLANHSKLVVAEVSSIDVMRVPWQYISQNLVGKDVMFANGDIYLGDGFQLVDSLLMAQQKIVYSLTRQVAEKDKCPGVNMTVNYENLCLDEHYMGSHDSFLLHLTEPLPDEALR